MHLGTLGRRSGEWREKWWLLWGVDGSTVYLLEENGERAQWIKNIRADGRVRVRWRNSQTFEGVARLIADTVESGRARGLVEATPIGATVRDLIEWGLPVAIDLTQ